MFLLRIVVLRSLRSKGPSGEPEHDESPLTDFFFMFGFAAIAVVICYFWNGPYFQQRVAENYGLKSQQRTQSNRKKM